MEAKLLYFPESIPERKPKLNTLDMTYVSIVNENATINIRKQKANAYRKSIRKANPIKETLSATFAGITLFGFIWAMYMLMYIFA